MSEHEDRPEERPEQVDRTPARDDRTGRSAAAARIQQQQTWVDLQVRRAIERGDFENLPGYGKPIEGLGAEHDPDWWLKKLVERERIAVLPPSLQLRKEDAELDDRLDLLAVESEVRREVEEFNQRVIAARYRPADGPPLITMPRGVEETVAAWEVRRAERRAAQRTAAAAAPSPPPRRRRWWRRRS
jgi:DnaJ homologue, subfamily C, member 28, conserved domain